MYEVEHWSDMSKDHLHQEMLLSNKSHLTSSTSTNSEYDFESGSV